VPTDFADFVNGLNEGFSLFKGLPHESECTIDRLAVYSDFVDAVNILKNVTMQSNLTEVFIQVSQKLQDVVTRYQTSVVGCEAFIVEVRKVNMAIVQYVTQPTYLYTLGLHALGNLQVIGQKFNTIEQGFQVGNFNAAGVAVGDLVRFVFFSDFKVTSTQ